MRGLLLTGSAAGAGAGAGAGVEAEAGASAKRFLEEAEEDEEEEEEESWRARGEVEKDRIARGRWATTSLDRAAAPAYLDARALNSGSGPLVYVCLRVCEMPLAFFFFFSVWEGVRKTYIFGFPHWL